MASSLPPNFPKTGQQYLTACHLKTIPDLLSTFPSTNTLNSRQLCIAPTSSGISDLVVTYPGFVLANPEADMPTAYTVTAAIEYPAGTFTPVYVNGSRTLPVTPSRGIFKFDPCPISIPAGASFWVKSFASWTPGNMWLSKRGGGCFAPGEWTHQGTSLTDQTLTSTVQPNDGTAGFGAHVLARFSKNIPVLGIIGDSVLEGSHDYGDPVSGALAVNRAMQGVIPVVNLARSADSAAVYLQRLEGRSLLLRDTITHLLMAYGRNDVSGSGIATIQANFMKIITPFLNRGVKVYGWTVTPYTTSTDLWATTANQTIQSTGAETDRVALNAWLRANYSAIGMSGLIDAAHAIDPTDSGKWSTDGAGDGGAIGFATLTSGSVSSVSYATYGDAETSAGTGFPVNTTLPCVVYPYPGDTGKGAAVNVTTDSSGTAATYTVVSGGSGYKYPPMISPPGAWSFDGIHPSPRGYNEIFYRCGVGPSLFA